MKKLFSLLLVCLMLFSILTLGGCSLPFGNGGGTEQLFDKCDALTGKWIYCDPASGAPTDTYFVFNGAADAMHFFYYESGTLAREGAFRAVYRGEGTDVATPLSIGFEIKDSEHRDWLNCYVDDFKTAFTQFTVMQEERDLPSSTASGVPQAHVYRMGELPFAFGTYVKEGADRKENKNLYQYAENYIIPAGTYVSESGERLTFLGDYYSFGMMLRYEDGDKAVEGIYTIAANKDKIFVWLDYQPGHKPDAAQKNAYEMSNNADFPPNYNLYGDFNVSGDTLSIRIDSATAIEGYGYDAAAADWKPGVYTKAAP